MGYSRNVLKYGAQEMYFRLETSKLDVDHPLLTTTHAACIHIYTFHYTAVANTKPFHKMK